MKTQISIFEVMKRFNTEEKCIAHFERIRWPKGLQCPRCKRKRIFKFDAEGKTGKERQLYECVDCHYQYSVTTGTVFHDSHLPLTKWFLAIYMICSAQKGVSAKQLQRELGVTYKTAWYMAHRIRLAMQEDDGFCRKFSGVVEVDEIYIGGKKAGRRGRGAASKIPVIGIKERISGKVRMQAVEVENIWSLFKRGIRGVFHRVSAKYLLLYLNEFAFRFNSRHQFNLYGQGFRNELLSLPYALIRPRNDF